MGRLTMAAVEHSYQEIDRQLKTIYTWISDEEMLAEIIRKLTKCDENMTIFSEHV